MTEYVCELSLRMLMLSVIGSNLPLKEGFPFDRGHIRWFDDFVGSMNSCLTTACS